MRNLFTASVALAMALTFSCSSEDGDDDLGSGSNPEISSSATEVIIDASSSSNDFNDVSSSSTEEDISSSSENGDVSSSSSAIVTPAPYYPPYNPPYNPPSVTWGDWSVTTAVTCENAGIETRTASDGSTQTREIDPLTWGEWAETIATCDAAGSRTRTCIGNTSQTETETIAKLTCNPGWTITKAPTCDEDGVETENETGVTRSIEKLTWNNWVVTNATCTTEGSKTRTCPGNASTAQTQAISAINWNASTEFCDSRDNNVYKKTTINGKTWMAQNLNYKVEGGSKCYGDNDNDCKTYGRLYNWATATNNACPSGWYLPTDDEWTTMITYVGGEGTYNSSRDVAAKYLKATSGWANNDKSSQDEYGFSALPGGKYDTSFGGVGYDGYWWSATADPSNASNAFRLYMYSSGINVLKAAENKTYFLSVRCVAN